MFLSQFEHVLVRLCASYRVFQLDVVYPLPSNRQLLSCDDQLYIEFAHLSLFYSDVDNQMTFAINFWCITGDINMMMIDMMF